MIEPDLGRILLDMADVGNATGTRLMLVGAWARDLCLGTPERARQTSDVDFALLIDSWDRVDAFLASACEVHFRDARRDELFVYHRSTGLKVDVVPCGQIESPTGTLALRGTSRRLNTVGIAECLALGTPVAQTRGAIVIPPPAGFLVLKLLAFRDRREPRDLRDFGYVLRRFPVDETKLWSDEALMTAFADGSLAYDDAPAWFAGRAIAHLFVEDTLAVVVSAIDAVASERDATRALLDEGVGGLDADERLDRADRALRVLRGACRRMQDP